MFAEAGLIFIGMGVRPPQPSWGQMLVEAGAYWQYAPHMFVFPPPMVTLSMLTFQGIADGLRTGLIFPAADTSVHAQISLPTVRVLLDIDGIKVYTLSQCICTTFYHILRYAKVLRFPDTANA